MALPDLRTPAAGFPDLDHSALAVKGAVPPELDGTLFRIGPEAGQPYVSALRLRHGHAEWFRARRIRTDGVCRQTGELPSPGPRPCASDDTAAAVIRHNRRTLALGDAALPYELAPDLRTKARWDFGGTLPAGFTSQAVHDPLTGELYAAVAGARTLDYAVVDVLGGVRTYLPIPTPHDPASYAFALTDRHAVFFGPASIGIMPREGGADDVVWTSTAGSGPNGRPVNAFDLPGGAVAIDAVGAAGSAPGLWRWRVDPGADSGSGSGSGSRAGSVRAELLNGRDQDLGSVDERYRGSGHRFALTRRLAADGAGRLSGIGLLWHDLATGTTRQHTPEPGRTLGAPVFVPYSPTAPEGHGWVLAAVRDGAQDREQVVIIDTADFAGPAVAAVELPGTGQREASACWQVADPW
jgi:carotenoid cleavage dioxygenase